MFAGILGRLYAKYALQYEQDYAVSLSLAVARILLSVPDGDDRARTFIERNQDRIKQEIIALKDETEIRRMVTDTMVMKTVAIHKGGGCSADEAAGPVERIKTLGVYLEGSQPPTPGSFTRSASRFLSASPLYPFSPWLNR